MKKIIRLTESQLHKLIEQTLNELDWKTYANAALKRCMQAADKKDRFAPDPELNRQEVDALDKKAEALADYASEVLNKHYNGANWKYRLPDHYDFEPPCKEFRKGVITGIPHDRLIARAHQYPHSFEAHAIAGYLNDESYYDDEKKRWIDGLDVPEEDKGKAKAFWNKFWGENDLGESLARRVTESIIRKLRRLN